MAPIIATEGIEDRGATRLVGLLLIDVLPTAPKRFASPPEGVTIANEFRIRSCRAGWHPNLAALQEYIRGYNFVPVEHPRVDDVSSVIDLQPGTFVLERGRKRPPEWEWEPLIRYNEVPRGVWLVLDGFVHARVNLGDGTMDTIAPPASHGHGISSPIAHQGAEDRRYAPGWTDDVLCSRKRSHAVHICGDDDLGRA